MPQVLLKGMFRCCVGAKEEHILLCLEKSSQASRPVGKAGEKKILNWGNRKFRGTLFIWYIVSTGWGKSSLLSFMWENDIIINK